ncbi:MAG: TRAP transporter small permease subunit [Candidatus Accumulibacter sp.]|jgi:TRAP-type C4-dicarboxylate transport system permease small subunit|nr:TRAP transporter small permease subunit [Accumulibacter sp.]
MLCKIEMGIAMSCLSISVITIFISAVMRVMAFPIRWGLDIALLLFTWSTFLGADIAFRKKCLVSVDMLVIRLPRPIRKTLEAVVYVLILASIVFLIYYGVKLTYFSWARPFQAIPSLSYSWVVASVPVSMFLMLISLLIQIHETYFRKNDDKARQ